MTIIRTAITRDDFKIVVNFQCAVIDGFFSTEYDDIGYDEDDSEGHDRQRLIIERDRIRQARIDDLEKDIKQVLAAAEEDEKVRGLTCEVATDGLLQQDKQFSVHVTWYSSDPLREKDPTLPQLLLKNAVKQWEAEQEEKAARLARKLADSELIQPHITMTKCAIVAYVES